MSNAYTRNLEESNRPRTQMEQADPRQVQNNAGGFVFQVSDTTRLERFLILGTSGGTYYQNEKDITKQNVDWLIGIIKRDHDLVWDTIKDVSDKGRAFRNSPAIFALALLFKHGAVKDVPATYVDKEDLDDNGKPKVKFISGFTYKAKTAKTLLPFVIRTFTHMSEFKRYAKLMKLSGRSVRSAVSAWYKTTEGRSADWLATQPVKDVGRVAYQAVKYRQRDGWTHQDVVRLAHPKGLDPKVGNFILGKPEFSSDPNPLIIHGFKKAQDAQNVTELLAILGDHPNLPWEALPTQFLRDPDVWQKLFYNGALNGQALVRNITRLARISAFNDMVFATDYAGKLVDEDMMARTRLHPLNYLNAIVVHTDGQIQRDPKKPGYMQRQKDWVTNPSIKDALNDGFHLAFKHVAPANKRTFIGVDVSGSMASSFGGLDLSCAQIAGAMAMTVARTEPYSDIRGFNTKTRSWSRNDTYLKDLGISAKTSLPEAMRRVQDNNFGSTDCSLPMQYALENKVEIDTFVVITDGETWYGKVHPFQALKNYRQATGIDARLVVVGITATEFSIADPSDKGMMDCVGADSNLPKVISEFSAGRV